MYKIYNTMPNILQGHPMDPLAAYADYVEGSLRLMIHYARHLTSG